MIELIAGIALGMVIGICFGFWVGFSFIKKQLPLLPKPEVKVDVHNEIQMPSRPVVQDRTPIERASDSTAEFISGL